MTATERDSIIAVVHRCSSEVGDSILSAFSAGREMFQIA